MPLPVLKALVKRYLATDQDTYTFGWQGGEPTLMGVDFFKKVTELQKSYGKPGASIANGIQTNATLLDDEFAKHLGQYRFLVGVSLDGPPDIHNHYRKTASGKPSHAAVIKGIDILRRRQVEFNILILVSQANVHHAKEVYRYLVDEGFYYHQYIPCVEFDGKGNLMSHAITGEEWGQFLCEIFDQWYPAHTGSVSVRYFDSLLNKLIHSSVTECTLSDNCCQYFVVEHNGDIYPCDFFVQRDLKLGNINTHTWRQALRSPIYRKFGSNKAKWNTKCRTCEYIQLCCGDCLKHRMYAGHPPKHISWLCTGLMHFFNHSKTALEGLAVKGRAG